MTGIDEIHHKNLPNGRTITVWPLTYGRARLVIGQTDAPWYDDGW